VMEPVRHLLKSFGDTSGAVDPIHGNRYAILPRLSYVAARSG
jgi:hypothetical protein